MQSDLLLTVLKSAVSKKSVEQLAKVIAESKFSIQELIDLTFYPDDQTAFRAAWVLETMYINDALSFVPFTEYFFSKLPQQQNASAQRHFGKILALMTHKRAVQPIKDRITNYETEKLVETVFSWLIDEKVPVAVKSHCLNILANLSSKHGWIRNELTETMEFLIDKESIAFYAKVKQIRKQLARL